MVRPAFGCPLPRCLTADDEGGEEEEEEGDRLDQQMGDAGDAAEAVDERMWDEDKDEDNGQQVRPGFMPNS